MLCLLRLCSSLAAASPPTRPSRALRVRVRRTIQDVRGRGRCVNDCTLADSDAYRSGLRDQRGLARSLFERVALATGHAHAAAARAWIQSESCLVALRIIQRRQTNGVLRSELEGLARLPVELWTLIEDTVLAEAYIGAQRTRYAAERDGQICECVRRGERIWCDFEDADAYAAWDLLPDDDPVHEHCLSHLADVWSYWLRDLGDLEEVRLTESTLR